jgi:hypothetical protein
VGRGKIDCSEAVTVSRITWRVAITKIAWRISLT